MRTGLLAEASLELDERVSTHPALRASDMADDESALLDRLVRPILVSVRVRIDDARRYAFASLAVVERRSTQGQSSAIADLSQAGSISFGTFR